MYVSGGGGGGGGVEEGRGVAYWSYEYENRAVGSHAVERHGATPRADIRSWSALIEVAQARREENCTLDWEGI